MAGKKSSGKVKNRNTDSNKTSRLQAEIKRCEKKMNKLLALYESGKKRHKVSRKGTRTEITKLQGMAADSQRHKAMLAHIESLKGKI